MRRHILYILLLLLPLASQAYDFQAGHLFYHIVDSAERLVEVCYEEPYRAPLYSRLRIVRIPATVTHDSSAYSVVGIAPLAFHSCPKLRRIRLPQTLQYIDSAAFAELHSLDSIVMPPALKRIGDAAFYHCKKLSYIDLPASVDSVGLNVFAYCHKLSRITVDPLNPVFDSRDSCNAVCRTDSARIIATCPKTTLPTSLLEIGEQAFAYSPFVRQALLPDSIRKIGYAAYAGCDEMDTLHLPRALSELGEWAFYGCKLIRHIELSDSLKSIPYSCFGECNDLREVVIPASVDSLAERAFYFSGIRTADLRAVHYIGHQCFSGCRFLHTLYLSANIVTIEPTALENCTALEHIYVPVGHKSRIRKLLPKTYTKIITER